MDPTTAIEWLRSAVAVGDRAAARIQARELLGWLRRGGFPPRGMTAEEARAECEKALA